jgi:hypothetical protein
MALRVLTLVFALTLMHIDGIWAQPNRGSTNKKKSDYATVRAGYGWTMSNDVYQRYFNPEDGIASSSAGSALLNFGVGPKLWLGNKNAALSLEGQAIWGMATYSVSDPKGYGSLGVPIMAKLNFLGLSGTAGQGSLGYAVGAGIQYSITELYGLKDEFKIKGVKRDFFRTYIVQGNIGFGVHGFALSGLFRYGFNMGTKSSLYSIGLQYDFNVPMLKEISNKESLLW